MQKEDPEKLPDRDRETEEGLLRVMTWATAISMAFLGAFLGSIESRRPFAMEFSVMTVAGFVIGGVFGWAIWQVVRRKIKTGS